MKSISGFVLLSFTLLSNVIFILVCQRNLESPIFISGNLRIIFFNIILAISIFFIKRILKSKHNQLSDYMDFSIYDIFSGIFISILSGIIFWSLGPTIIDRSLSVNILGTLYLAKEPLSTDDLNWSLYKNYMNGKFQAEKRIKEQLFLGNIKQLEDKRFILTKKGSRTAKTNIIISKYFNLNTSSSLPERSPIERKF